MDPPTREITQWLQAWSEGDRSALNRLAPLVEAELHRLAAHYMRRERPGHILQTTALVNEAFHRLIDWENVNWRNRAHFYGVSAQMMRRVLVDFARKRPRNDAGSVVHLELDEARQVPENRRVDLIALDEALASLAAIDERKSRIVELRFFGGLSVEETAEVMRLSAVTVMREWKKARMWLYRELQENRK